ncbi:MAG TPA: lytic transglycosylase domain-containing protein [Candidatus Limnocylindria bacterium]|nr:lytic transglycosylase domain-containing protein [Candidatus Limnocylindria bacterium]
MLMAPAGPSHADVYVVRDPSGTIVLTNVPAASETATTERVYADTPGAAAVAVGTVPAAYWGPSFTPVPDDGRYDELIREVADRHGLEFALVKAIVRAESGFDPFAVSRKGARGLMQLMPATARMHGVRESFRPRDNVDGGARHLRQLLDRYGGNLPLALAAYNAGEARVEAARGIPNIRETRAYVFKVLRYRKRYLEAEGGGVLQARR